MSSFKEKERFKEQQEQFQAVLSALLKDEDNKYCVDCDAKGPRWASWNIGIFLCIRCAGIHRNLGVHISKVKSVNLDTWTPEQVAMMQEMGNSRGRAVYEANIPDGFRRPQTDSSLEAFIRSKYEHKKYIAREWIPPQAKVPKEWLEDPRGDKKKAKAKPTASSLQLTNVTKLTNKSGEPTPQGDLAKPARGPTKSEVKVPTHTETVSNSASNDLLGLEAAAPPPSYGGNELLDLFGGAQISQTPNNTAPTQSNNTDLMNKTSDGNLFGDDKGTGGGGGTNTKTSAKDSIMALYGGGGGSTNQPQMYGVPGSGLWSYIYQPPASRSDMTITNFSTNASHSHAMMQPSLTHPSSDFNAHTTQQPSFNQSATTSVSALANQQFSFDQRVSGFGVASNQTVCNPNVQSGQYLPFSQSSVHGFHQTTVPVSSTIQASSSSGQFLTTTKQIPDFSNKPNMVMASQDFGQSLRPNNVWGSYNLAQPAYYGNQGGVYMQQGGQPLYPGAMAQPQGMMGIQGVRQQGMIGQPIGMMGQPQGMGMMGQPHGLLGNPVMNTPQMAMYNGQMMAGGGPGMYTPQQMQQLQFQQMQQQMATIKLGGSQISSVPQQTAGTGGWGNPSQGQTLSTNLWQ